MIITFVEAMHFNLITVTVLLLICANLFVLIFCALCPCVNFSPVEVVQSGESILVTLNVYIGAL